MPQPYGQAVITNLGEELLAKAAAGHGQIEYVCMAIGNGDYSEKEKGHAALKAQTKLKIEKNRYAFSDVVLENKAVRLTALLTNQDPLTSMGLVPEGYYINEVGIYAKEKGADNSTAILYSMCVTASDTGQGDYMPEYNGYNRSEITQDYILSVDDSVEISVNMIGAVALAADVERCKDKIKQHIENLNNPHQTDKAQVGLDKVDNTPDISKPVSTAQQDAIDAAYRQATAYADRIVNALVNGAPNTLDTLGEIAEAMKENADVVQSLEQAIGSKASEADFAGHAGNNTVHITASERQTWNGKADANHSHDYLPLSGGIMNGPIQWFSNEVGHGALIGAFQYSHGNQFCLAPDGWATTEDLQSILYLGYVDGELQIKPRVNGAPWYLTGFRSKFNSGDNDNPTGWADVAVMESGEEHSSLWRKISLFCKNVRYLWKLMGNTSLSGIGDGTVTGAISALNTGLEDNSSRTPIYMTWDGTHIADDYRLANIVMYCNPAAGDMISHNFPCNNTGLFLSWYCASTLQLFASQTGLYYRFAIDVDYPFSGWQKFNVQQDNCPI